MNKHVAVFLALFGSWAIILQAIGVFSPAWIICKFRAHNEEFDLYMGLWASTACYNLHNERTCRTVSSADIEEKMAIRDDPGSVKLLDDWIALQLLAVTAGASAIAGVIALVTYARPGNEKDLCHAGIVAGSWLLSGCLILTAFGLAGSVNHNFSRQADSFNHMGTGRKMEFALPWAIVVSGVGGFFAAVAGVVMVVFWVFKDRREVPGMWIPF